MRKGLLCILLLVSVLAFGQRRAVMSGCELLGWSEKVGSAKGFWDFSELNRGGRIQAEYMSFGDMLGRVIPASTAKEREVSYNRLLPGDYILSVNTAEGLTSYKIYITTNR